ncbi:MAG: glycosyltransferase family 2 protein [Akkermansiaceae bacterium]
MSETKKDVAVVIVTYNSANEIETCLSSVIAERKAVMQEIVVVDNQSQDDTVKIIKEKFPEVKLVIPEENLGFAKGVNLGVKNSNAKYVLLLNPDTEVMNHAVDIVYDFATKNPKYGLYGGRTLTPEGELEPSSCWGEPTLWSMACFAFGLTTLIPRHPVLDPESLGRWKRDSVREVGVITGCFLLVKASVWDELSGLDERYFMYGEDADFAIRARKLGYRPVICPDAEVIHEVGMSSVTPVHKTLLLYRGKASLIRNHWVGLKQFLGLFMLAAGTLLRAVISKLLGIVRPHSQYTKWPEVWAKRGEWLQGYGA